MPTRFPQIASSGRTTPTRALLHAFGVSVLLLAAGLWVSHPVAHSHCGAPGPTHDCIFCQQGASSSAALTPSTSPPLPLTVSVLAAISRDDQQVPPHAISASPDPRGPPCRIG